MRPQTIDRAALTRQFLAAAANGACDAVLTGVTPRDAALPQIANVKNEPKPPNPPNPIPYVTAQRPAPARTAARDTVLPGVTPGNATLPISPNGKTNPPRQSMTSLSTQQLAAARLLACGHAPAEVAAELRVSRMTLWRWRHRADFDAEVFRLHECLVWTAGVAARRR